MIHVGPHRICSNCLKMLKIGSQMSYRTKWTSTAIRQSFIDFFCQNHDHKFVRSSPVIPYKNQGTYFTNAGMNQFKALFLGTVDKKHPMADYKRVANSQKCVRVGGKHNDLEDVGKDLFHHTFFEMLGSWSFGDYFKKEACNMALELLTKVYKLPINRLYFTYFGGDSSLGLEPDLETRDIWRSLGVPSERIVPYGLKDNFWDMGETGPCGPCTEIHYDHTGRPDAVNLVNKGTSDVLEIWNLVFMQYNRKTDGGLEPLDRVHVDTGMGLERMLAVMNQSSSTYNTDLFLPTFTAIQKACNNIKPYGGQIDDPVDIAYRIIADHIRMATVCIADGLLPGNKNQGNKLRAVLFRCLHQSKKILQIPQRVVPSLVDIVVDSLGEAYPELEENRGMIKEVVLEAEHWYDNTIVVGEKAFQKYLSKYPNQRHLTAQSLMEILDGRFTEGHSIPIEMLPDLGLLYNVTLDMEGLHKLVENQKALEQQIVNTERVVFSPETLREVIQQGVKPTDDRLKYDYSKVETEYIFPQGTKAVIKSIVKDDNLFTTATGSEDFGILLDRTLFYGEAGGQTADKGYIKSSHGVFKVTDVQNYNNYVLHIGHMESGKFTVGDSVNLFIDEKHRIGCMRNHTATHILNSCLRKMYKHVNQEGSRIYSDKFSFNFSSMTRMAPEDLDSIQDTIQDVIDSDMRVMRKLRPLDEALQIPNIISMKNEEYPGDVYTVSLINEMDAYSTELCGGTHVLSTEDIGSFCIISASLSQQGIKRMTCLTGDHAKKAIEHGQKMQREYQELESMLTSKTNPETWMDRIKQMNKELKKDVPKRVYDDLRVKVDRLGDPMKTVINIIKKDELKKVILAKIDENTDKFCTVTTDVSLTPQVMNQVLVAVNADIPLLVVPLKEKNAQVFVCFTEEMNLSDFEQRLENSDEEIRVKKTLKNNLVILNIAYKDKTLDAASIVCNLLKSVLK